MDSRSKGKDSDDPIDIVLLDIKTGDAGLNTIQGGKLKLEFPKGGHIPLSRRRTTY